MADRDKDKGFTDFGYEKVPWEEKQTRVNQVFDSVAENYDLMNDLMSFGLHRLWKWFTVEVAGVQPGQRVLDLAGGTGDLAAAFAQRTGPAGLVTIADINDHMLTCGRRRLIDRGCAGNLVYVQADAQALPFADQASTASPSALACATCRTRIRPCARCTGPCGRADVRWCWSSHARVCRA